MKFKIRKYLMFLKYEKLHTTTNYDVYLCFVRNTFNSLKKKIHLMLFNYIYIAVTTGNF